MPPEGTLEMSLVIFGVTLLIVLVLFFVVRDRIKNGKE
jgi:hypothetical protein